jgi:hypothetical protein
VIGPVATLRRRWLRSVGWYPGDWVWLPLAALAVAIVGTAASIAFTHHSRVAAAATVVARTPRFVTPTPTPSGPDGRTVWPAGLDGWTVILLSSPATLGSKAPRALAARAARNGLPQVGILDSSGYASLHPGYDVVFSGVYSALADAETALQTVRARGFGSAYTRQISP